MKRRLLIVDPVVNRSYDASDLDCPNITSSEASYLRIASALSDNFEVYFAQGGRDNYSELGNIRYQPFDHNSKPLDFNCDIVIVVRSHHVLSQIRRWFRQAQLYLWISSFPGNQFHNLGEICFTTQTQIVGVSKVQVSSLRAYLRRQSPRIAGRTRITHIYNPLPQAVEKLGPSSAELNPWKLVYVNPPHRGLEQVLRRFTYCKRFYPYLKLHIVYPEKCQGPIFPHVQGTLLHSSSSQTLTLKLLREAFCLFCPQEQSLEAFELRFAEANALGVPVLCHDFGSASEVVTGCRSQVLAEPTKEKTLETLDSWYECGRPEVRANPDFKLETVIANWQHLIGAEQASAWSMHGT